MEERSQRQVDGKVWQRKKRYGGFKGGNVLKKR